MYDEQAWLKCVEFHGHACPGLAIGFKAVEGALAELELHPGTTSNDEEIVCVTENDACGVDAIQRLLSCTFGKGNLIPRLRGKMAFSFFIRGTQKRVRLCLDPDAEPDLPRGELMEHILNSPYDRVFIVDRPRYKLPEEARIFTSQRCIVCGEKTAEPMLRLDCGDPVCLDCYHAYQREGF